MILACLMCCGCADPLEEAVREGQVAVAAAYRDVAAEVDAGKHKTAETAANALDKRIRETRGAAYEPLYRHVGQAEGGDYASRMRDVANAFEPNAFDWTDLAFALFGFAGGAWFMRGAKA